MRVEKISTKSSIIKYTFPVIQWAVKNFSSISNGLSIFPSDG